MKQNPNDEITLMLDVKTKKVGCVILQAVAGLSHNNGVVQLFDNWETSPTPDMKRVTGTRAQWEALAQKENLSRKSEVENQNKP